MPVAMRTRTRGQVFGAVRVALRRALTALEGDAEVADATHRVYNAWQVRLSALEVIAPDLRVVDDVADVIGNMVEEIDHLDAETLTEWIDLLPRTATSLLTVRATLLTGEEVSRAEEAAFPETRRAHESVSWDRWEVEDELAVVGPSRAA